MLSCRNPSPMLLFQVLKDDGYEAGPSVGLEIAGVCHGLWAQVLGFLYSGLFEFCQVVFCSIPLVSSVWPSYLSAYLGFPTPACLVTVTASSWLTPLLLETNDIVHLRRKLCSFLSIFLCSTLSSNSSHLRTPLLYQVTITISCGYLFEITSFKY